VVSDGALRVPRAVADEVVAHARAAVPNEACGYLVGLDDQVTRFVPVVNAEPSPYFYRMDPEDQLRIEAELAESGEDVVASYHSHTRSPAFPSRTDLDLAGPFEGTYVILSLASDPPALKAFTMGRGRIAPRPLVVEG
jgi:proteasome lid subunit RPN8/RPN11